MHAMAGLGTAGPSITGGGAADRRAVQNPEKLGMSESETMTVWRGPQLRRAGLALLVLAGLIAALLLPGGGARTQAQSGPAQELIALVNQYRTARGLNALAVHPALMAAAQGHVDWMVANNSYGHTGAGGSTPGDRARAAGYPTNGATVYENWVGGGGMTPAEAIEWWNASPIHYATLNLANYQHIGVGYSTAGRGAVYVLLIARPVEPTPTPRPGQAAAAEPPGPPTPTPYYVEPIVRATPDGEGTIVHLVGAGQTAWDIAIVYEVDLNEMLAINGLQRPVVLHPGDELIVKLGPNATPPPRAPRYHTVSEGESAWTIAAIYGITLDALLEANGLVRPAILQPGQVVIVPPPQPPTPTPTPAP